MPGLSVIIPFYNYKQVAKKFVDVAIQTALHWSGVDPEVIVVLDSTEENTGEEAVDKWQGHPKVRIIKRPRPPRGLQVARIEGLRQATKEYVCVFDADDSSFRNFKEIQIEALEKEKAEVCFCQWQLYDSKLVNTDWDITKNTGKYGPGEKIVHSSDVVYGNVKNNWDNHRYKKVFEPLNGILLCASWIIKRQTLLDIGLLDDNLMPQTGEEILHMELDFTYGLVLRTKQAIVHTGQMYLYRTAYNENTNYGDGDISWK